jgi:uncharacterized protein
MEQNLQQYLQKSIPDVSSKSASAVLELAAEGGTVPFIARYRKEKTGNLDEVQIRAVIEANETYQEIVKRKAFLVKEIGEQGNLTGELQKRIEKSWDLNELEELYRPYKKKKKTKATLARDAGLDPLATWLWDLGHDLIKDDVTMEMKAKNFLNIAAGIVSYDLALKGAQDILVEKIANEPELRVKVRNNFFEKGQVSSKRTKSFKPHSKYEMYQEFKEPVKSLLDVKASHRYMAMRRGWEEEELSVEVAGDEPMLVKMFEDFSTTQKDNAIGTFLRTSAKQALTVYVIPSVVNEVHKALKDKSDQDAIRVFAENVRKVLLGSPFGPKIVLGVDPGLKTGCKIALVDKGGNFITHTVMQILGDQAEEKAKILFAETTKNIHIEAIAVGNGTAGRQAEIFVRKVLKDIGKEIPVVMVSESGASVYSASDIARQEFPNLDLTVKGAISIARRLQDPLSELVKVDPKSIGVGQYQHDVNQSQLKKGLEGVVESCVNTVGVDLNTASEVLLAYVSGIGPGMAKNIVDYRKEHLFEDRSELLKVPKFSTKAYEQAAGFLRIMSGKVVLDKTGIHPERYPAVRDMAHELSVGITDLVGEGAKKLVQLRTKWAAIIGEFTFDDILRELEKPGRDPRDPFKAFQFRDDIFEVKDLKADMICPGIVTNVTNFGAFVDIGVHQDGLVHISELSHKFVEDPRKVVNPGDHVTIRVLAVDLNKKQISLSMKLEASASSSATTEKRQDRRPPREQSRQQDGQPGGQRQNARGPRPQHAGNRDGNREGGGRPQQRPSAGGDQRRQGSGPQQQRSNQPLKPQGKPFNNPFAALQGINNSKK